VWVSFESFTPKDLTVQVNEVYADAYMDALRSLNKRYNFEQIPLGTSLDLLAKVPDIIVFDRYESALSTESARNEIWETLSDAMDQAVAQFNGMRETEGAALIADIEAKHARTCMLIAEIRARVPYNQDSQAAKLRERVKDLVAKMGGKAEDGRILTEIALLTDKGDVNEELTRLESHVHQLKHMLTEDEAVGRKMDFLVQEMNREANTIGSKSTDIQLTKLVVELKSVVEKIREQVQNIE